MTLAERIKQLRKENHMTQEVLAEKLGISRQTISKWESGVAQPSLESIAQLCNLFNISSDYLLGNDIVSAPTTAPKQNKCYWGEIFLIVIGLIGTLIFGILSFSGKSNEATSMITINGYGFFAIFCIILIVAVMVVMIKKRRK